MMRPRTPHQSRPGSLAAAGAVAVCGALLAPLPAHAGPIQVIATNLPGHPTAAVPGLSGHWFNPGTTTQFDRPFASPRGGFWIIRARLAPPATAADNEVVLIGSGLDAGVVLREGTPTGLAAGELFGSIRTVMGINDRGQFVLACETLAPGGAGEAIFRWNGSAMSAVARTGGAAPGTGGGLFGAGLDSVGILNDAAGTVYFRAGRIDGGARDAQAVWYRGDAVMAATLDPAFAPLDQLSDPSESWELLGANRFRMDASGSNWIGFGDLLPPGSPSDQVLVVNNAVKTQVGTVIPGDPLGRTVAATLSPAAEFISADGRSWMARSAFTNDQDFVFRNGAIIAATDGPITLRPGETERFSDDAFAQTFFLNTGNSAGDYIIGGVTNAPSPAADAVVVLNSQRVVLREGTPIDLNGDGLPNDDAFLGLFNNDDAFLTDDGWLYFAADIRNAAGSLTGQGFFRTHLCKADWNGDGGVTSGDVSAFLTDWVGSMSPPSLLADFDRNGSVSSADISAFLAAWLDAFTRGC